MQLVSITFACQLYFGHCRYLTSLQFFLLLPRDASAERGCEICEVFAKPEVRCTRCEWARG